MMEEHLVKYVHPTGFWYKDLAIYLHLDSVELKDWLINFLKDYQDKMIYDLGCGTGYYLAELHKAGHKRLLGIEAEPCKLHEEFPILAFNLTDPIELTEKGIVICLEVGEHIPDEYEHMILDNLASLCDSWLILSWALPGQSGVGHFNCRSNQYIITQIESRGFEFIPDITNEARKHPVGVTGYFQKTLMIFKRYDR
jgi:hypothetical protein